MAGEKDNNRREGAITRSAAARPVRGSPRTRAGSEPPRSPRVPKPRASRPQGAPALEEKPDKAIAYMVDVRGTIDARMHDIRNALLGDVDNLLAPLQAAYTTLEARVSEIQTEVQSLVANPAATLADQATLQELTNQVRALRVDVNTLMEGRPAEAGPSTTAANDNRFERVNNRLIRVEEAEQRLQSLLTTLEVRVEDITAGEAGLSAPLATQRPEVVPPVSTQDVQHLQARSRREEPRETPRAEYRRSRRNGSRDRPDSDR